MSNDKFGLGEAMDVIDLEVLENGTLKITTPSLSDVNHARADALVQKLLELIGGDVVVERKQEEGHHHHEGTHHHHHARKLGQ